MNMADFSKYLGNNENVLNAIDMKDESLWQEKNDGTSGWKSWMTLVVTNKRLFMINKRKYKFMELRHDDIVATGWEFKPNHGELVRCLFALALSVVAFVSIPWTYPFAVKTLKSLSIAFEAYHVFIGLAGIGFFFLLMALFHLFMYYMFRRTILTVSARDGKDYRFLLRGRRQRIDDFRLSLQNAKDLSIEEKENLYFTKMNTVLINQANYQKSLMDEERQKNEKLIQQHIDALNKAEKSYIEATGKDTETYELPNQEQQLLEQSNPSLEYEEAPKLPESKHIIDMPQKDESDSKQD